MADESTLPVDVDQIECAPLGRAKLAVRITGRWRHRRRLPDARAFLVIEADGRRHRFPAMPEPRRARIGRSGAWAGTFALPSSLEPRIHDAMSLWLGDIEIPLPRPSYVAKLQDMPADAQAAAVDDKPEPPRDTTDDGHQPAGTATEDADELRATVGALRAELQQRAAAEAQIHGALAGTRAELERRAAHQAALEDTQAELREQLAELLGLTERDSAQRAAVESRAVVLAGEVAELQEQLSELTAARDQIAEESNTLRSELERAGREAVELRDELGQLRAVAERDGAERVLLETRTAELSEQLAGLHVEFARSEVARDAALGEAAGLREELEHLAAELSHARDIAHPDDGLSEAEALLEEARAATARLRGTA